MVETTRNVKVYSHINNGMQFKVNEMNRKISDNIFNKTFTKYIATFHYFGKTLLILSATSDSVSSFATVTDAPFGTTSANLSFLFSMELLKKLLKTMGKKLRKVILVVRSKLNSVENIISKGLTNKEISHEGFTLIMNKENNYYELKESKRMIKNQITDI